MAGAALPVASSGIDGADIPLLNCDGGDLNGTAMRFRLSRGKGAIHGRWRGLGGRHARWLIISRGGVGTWRCRRELQRIGVGEVGGEGRGSMWAAGLGWDLSSGLINLCGYGPLIDLFSPFLIYPSVWCQPYHLASST